MILYNKIFVNEDFSAKKIFSISIGITIFALIVGDYALYGCIGLLLILFSFLYGERFVLPFIIISLFTLVGDVSTQLRLVVHLIDFTLLGILFLKRFGLKWNSYPRIPKVVFFFLVLYYSSMILSSAMSDYPLAGITNIIRQSIFFIIAYIFYALIKDESDIKIYCIAIILATSVLASSTIFSFVMEGYSLIDLNFGLRSRVAGLITNPNIITNFYMISFPLILISLLYNKYPLSKTISWFLLLFFCIGLVLTISRTAIIGILISTLTIFYMFKKKYFYQSIIALLILVIILIVYEPLGSVASLLFRLERGLTGRDHIWVISMDIIKDNPVFGIGVGAYKYEMFNYFPVMFNSWVGQELIKLHKITGTGVNLSHNFFLGFFTDMGILGLIAALTLPVVYFKIGIKTLKIYKNRNKETYYLIVALFLGGATMFIRGLVDNVGILSYGVISSDLPFWLILGSLVYYYNRANIFLNE
jgi:putative inorganic carbon (HCO3(-)) transporter